MDFWLKVSDNFLEAVTLAAIEAYCFGDGRDNPEIETFGDIWGIYNSQVLMYLDRASVSLAALRRSGSVAPNREAAKLKNAVIQNWSPHLSMLGHFHTHPYKNLNEVNRNGGFGFSAGDFAFAKADDLSWDESGDSPVMLAVTICRMGRVRDTQAESISDNVYRYNVGEFRIWINASAGYIDENEERQFTPTRQAAGGENKTYLDFIPNSLNDAGNRMQQQRP